MRLTAKDVAERLGVSYVVASGILSHLEKTGKIKVADKRFHVSGKGKPTRVYEMDREVVIDFGDELVAEKVVEADKRVEAVATTVHEAVSVAPEKKPDHVSAAVARLRASMDS